MTIQDKIKMLESQLADLKNQQNRCSHEWGDAKYTPYKGKKRGDRSWCVRSSRC